MSFSAESDLNLSAQRLIELTDSEEAVGVKDQAVVDKLHVRATSKVNAAVFGKYVVDPVTFPPILTELEADLWRYYLYEHREVMAIPPTVQKAYDAAIVLLEQYRTGLELLDAPLRSAATGPGPSSGSFSSDSDDRIFGRAKDGLF